MKRQGDTIDNVGVHAVENLAGSLESINDSRETRSQENDISGRTSGIRGTLNSNTSIGLLERRSIVNTITSHGNQVTTLLQDLDDVVLVLGENFSETIGSLNEIVDLRTRHITTTRKTKTFSVVDVGTETELAGSFTSNTDGVTSQHLDGQTESLGFVDSLGGIVTRRVRARHDTENLPMAFTTLAGNTEGTETTGSEFGDLVLVVVGNFFRDRMIFFDSTKHEKRGTLDTDNTFTLGRLDNGGDLLGNRIEGVELEDLVAGKNVFGTRVETERLQESFVDSVKTLLLAGSSQTSGEHEIIGLNTFNSVGFSERQLVLGEGTGLVRAENLNTSKRFNGGELLNNGLLLGEICGTDSHGGGDDSGKTDRDTNNSNGEGEFQDSDDTIIAVER